MQHRGEVNDPPCDFCARGSGPFTVCVSLRTEPKVAGDGCANHQVGNHASRCSYRKLESFRNCSILTVARLQPSISVASRFLCCSESSPA